MLICGESNCGAKFSTTVDYKRHLDNKHSPVGEFTCIQGDCKTASRTFSQWKNLTRHFHIVHKEDLSTNQPVPIPRKRKLSVQEDAPIAQEAKRPSIPQNSDCSTSSTGSKDLYAGKTVATHQQFKILLYTVISDLLFQFCATLYAKNVARSLIQVVMVFLQSFLEVIIKRVKEELKRNLRCYGVTEDIINKSLVVFDELTKPFENFCTEQLRLRELKKQNFVEPVPFVMGECDQPVSRYSSLEFVPSPLTGQFIPLRKTFGQFFAIKSVLTTVLDYTQRHEKNCKVYSNFVHGAYWQKKRFDDFFRDKKVIPFNIYFDEFEVNNPLGSHKNVQKVGAVYCYFPTLPEEHRSKLENIFLVSLFNANDKNDNERAFKLLVHEINFLQDNGLEFQTDGIKETVYFALGLITGDNKGVNDILGFSDFNAKFYCRFCKSPIDNNRKDCELKEDLLRKVEEYEDDVAAGAANTGVKEHSIWNRIRFFHVYVNYFVDIMHDVTEGVFKYDMGHILYYMVIVKKWFTVSDLNERMDCFNYNFSSIRNRPPPITLTNVEKKKIVMSASETVTFVKLFAFFVSDFVDKDDEVWKFYIAIRELYDLINSSIFQPEMIILVPNLVKQHHLFYMKLFSDTLKPKFHHLLHYAMCIIMSGPLKWICALRGEAKHQKLKNIAKTTTSRKNILYTIALREQMNVCFRFNSDAPGLNENIDVGPCILFDVKDYHPRLITQIPDSILTNSAETDWVAINGTKYKVGSFVLVAHPYGEQPLFGIIKIIIFKDKCFHIIYRKLDTENFDENIFAYKVTKTDEYLYLNDVKKLYRPETLVAKELSCGKTYVLANKAL